MSAACRGSRAACIDFEAFGQHHRVACSLGVRQESEHAHHSAPYPSVNKGNMQGLKWLWQPMFRLGFAIDRNRYDPAIWKFFGGEKSRSSKPAGISSVSSRSSRETLLQGNSSR